MLEGGGKHDGVMNHVENKIAVRKQLGARIRDKRRRQGLTQRDLALMVGLDRSYISGVENGKRNASFDNIVKIACGLGITLYELMWGIEIPSQKSTYTYYHAKDARLKGNS